jgi:hypothetical protein
METEQKSHTSEGWAKKCYFPLLVSSSHHLVMDRIHAWDTEHWDFSSTSKIDMSKYHDLYKWTNDKVYSEAYNIPTAFWYHHPCTWNMISLTARFVITTKSCSWEVASAAFQSWSTTDFLLHVNNNITIEIYSWGPSQV